MKKTKTHFWIIYQKTLNKHIVKNFIVCGKEKSLLVEKYNLYKGGLDTADSYWSRYLVGFRHHKWTRTVGFALIKVALANSLLIFRSMNYEEKISQREFMEQIIISHLNKINKK